MFSYSKSEQNQESKIMAQKKEPKKKVAAQNMTGIPAGMKTRFENLSGFSFDDVRVHYNSDKPAQLQALAYTRGNQVYVSSGQERHLGHELGHVVQQKQGRVRSTIQLQGIGMNDSEELEQEADIIDRESSAMQNPLRQSDRYTRAVISGTKSNSVAQLCSTYEKLYNFAIGGEESKFKELFRRISPGMHELYSCRDTYQAIRSASSKAVALDIIMSSDTTRMPTEWTGAHVKDISGSPFQIQHPTSPSSNPYSAPITSKQHIRSLGSTSFHTTLHKAVESKPDFESGFKTSIAMNLGGFIQPPFAQNSIVKKDISDKEAREAAFLREQLKLQIPGFDKTITQPYTASWYPDPSRPPSPFRTIPPK